MKTSVKHIVVGALMVVGCVAFAADGQAPAGKEGTATAWGYNGGASLGNGSKINAALPVLVEFPSDVRVSKIAAGSMESLAITNDGLYTWPTIPGTIRISLRPVPVPLPPSVTSILAISAGDAHKLVLTNDGVYAWGENIFGQVGDGTTINRLSPVKIHFPSPVTAIFTVVAGHYHSLALTDDGLYAWGNNTSGTLGDGTLVNRISPTKVNLPVTITQITDIAAGLMDSFIVTNDGLYAWGYNTYGELGDGTSGNLRMNPVKVLTFGSQVTKVTRVAAGEFQTLAITNDGVYAWGSNTSGLGDGKTVLSSVPVKVKFPKDVTSFRAIAAGWLHGLALTNRGLFAWGYNAQGQLGIGDTNRNPDTPVRVTAESNVKDISAGWYFSLALH